MFSWFAQDTNRRIVADEPHTYYMTDNRGNTWREDCYEGYGVFGGKDYYELLAEMNGAGSDRGKGIELAFAKDSQGNPHPAGDNPDIMYPSLTERKGWYCGGQPPKPDPNQGFREPYC